MIIARSPLRLSLGGGGSDIPSFYRKFGGELISASIDKYVYISAGDNFKKKFTLKYSKLEEIENIYKIKHNLFREILKYFKIRKYLNIASHADIPHGTGLGSSGAFSVALAKCLATVENKKLSNYQIAEIACFIEMNVLKEPSGKQDPFASSIGNFIVQKYDTNGNVKIRKLKIDKKNKRKLNKNLLLYFTGYSRDSAKILNSHSKFKTKKQENNISNNLNSILEIGKKNIFYFENGMLDDFGSLMHEHWMIKKKRQNIMSNKKIDDIYEYATKNHALGGKIVGAGGGGFLLFYSNKPEKLRHAMKKTKIFETKFKFEDEGASVICKND